MEEQDRDPQDSAPANTEPPAQEPAPPPYAPQQPDSAEPVNGPEDAPRRRRGLRWLLVLVILAALAIAAWYGWQHRSEIWGDQASSPAATNHQARSAEQTHDDISVRTDDRASDKGVDPAVASTARVTALATGLTDLQGSIDARSRVVDQQVANLQSQLANAKRNNGALQQRLDGLTQRITATEKATAELARERTRGALRMRLADVEMLLTQASQRYQLLHDGVGALLALRMARSQLKQIDDPVFASVIRTLDDEISALAATRPEARSAQLQQIESLRQQWPDLPRKPIDQQPAVQHGETWKRIKDALSSLVVVSHDSGEETLRSANEALARQVGQIHLADAQAALLNGDSEAARAALTRARKALVVGHDPKSRAVTSFDDQLQQLSEQLAQAEAVDVQLGAALTALQNQMQVQRMNDAASASASEQP